MKLRLTLGRLITGGVILLSLASIQAQDLPSDLTPISAEDAPVYGTYWSMAHWPYYPPCPMNCWGIGLDLYYSASVGTNTIWVDDSFTTSGRMSAEDIDYPPDPGGGGDLGFSPWPPDYRRNFVKFASQTFEYINTNDVEDSVLASLITNFPPSAPGPNLQILPYGTNAVVIKANHFDYSAETRNFALIVSDAVEKPIWKNVDLAGASDAQDGWVIQGMVPNVGVFDSMYFVVSNLYPRQAFFNAIPYSGPLVRLTGAPADYTTVSNSISFEVAISDLSGTTNSIATVDVNGLTARYALGASNTVTLDTRYAWNGGDNIHVTVFNYSATIYAGSTNVPSDTRYTFNTVATLPLDFENETYVYFQSDNASPAIGTNFMLYGVTPPVYVTGTITDPSSGRTIRTFGGYNTNSSIIELDWDFTDSDTVSPYTNDTYTMTFAASNSPSDVATLVVTNNIQRKGVRVAHWVINEWEEMGPKDVDPHWWVFRNDDADFINSEFKKWQDTSEFMYDTLYFNDFASQSQYFAYQIGAVRDNPTIGGVAGTIFPFQLTPFTESGWKTRLEGWLTNADYSDFNWSGHGGEIVIGGGVFAPGSQQNHINTFITTGEVYNWARGVPGPNWRIRKAAMWSCESGHNMVPAVLPPGVNAGPGYWPTALGIYATEQQENSFQDKNCGLFFDGDVFFDPLPPITGLYGSSTGAGPAHLPEVATAFETYWVMGQFPWPGGANPNYSMQFARNVIITLYPELLVSKPVLIGYPWLPYSGQYDNELRAGDHHQVVQ